MPWLLYSLQSSEFKSQDKNRQILYSLESGPSPCMPIASPPPAIGMHGEGPDSRLPGRTALPASHTRPSTRQKASAFNQPLSFDTSKVMTMDSMFYVRSARALPPPQP